jgi:iron complex outermembrane recepter protein
MLNIFTYIKRRIFYFNPLIMQNQYCGRFSLAFLTISLTLICNVAFAQITNNPSPDELKKLSVEELLNLDVIEVTSVSGKSERLTEVASAIQVITGSDIRRSGVTRLPEALRLASNLQVAQGNSHDWSITARGFSGLPSAGGILANKLLVMVDGRSIYTPLFGGVWWDSQNLLLEDLDRIEVVSGPGGTLWGANAVNGVISIITKSSKETQGLYISRAAGSFMKDIEAARYGFRLDSNLYMRVYGQRYTQRHTWMANGTDNKDAWRMTQGGFRMDYYPSEANTFTLQGDFYGGLLNDSIRRANLDGQNGLARWTHNFSDSSKLKVQAYFDRSWRKTPRSKNPFYYELYTYDLDIQHGFSVGRRQNILYGIGYRFVRDKTASTFNPLSRDMPLYSGFIQDELIFVPNKFKLTVGSKFLQNVFSGFEIQPSARLAWTPDTSNTIWSAVSRAVRTPSRFDSDVIANPVKFDSEKVIAYELGYRLRPVDKLFLSFATFYNQYNALRSIDSNSAPPPTLILANNQRAESWGFEFSGTFQANNWWRMRGGYTYFEKRIQAANSKVLAASSEFEGVDPQHQLMFQSMMDLFKNFQLDLTGRYIEVIPAATITKRVPAYFSFDVRLAYTVKIFELSLVGQNLFENKHIETGTTNIPRSLYGKVTCRF